MLQFAALCFALTLTTSLMGFGGLIDSAVVLTKGIAVVSLVLFCAAAYRGLYQT